MKWISRENRDHGHEKKAWNRPNYGIFVNLNFRGCFLRNVWSLESRNLLCLHWAAHTFGGSLPAHCCYCNICGLRSRNLRNKTYILRAFRLFFREFREFCLSQFCPGITTVFHDFSWPWNGPWNPGKSWSRETVTGTLQPNSGERQKKKDRSRLQGKMKKGSIQSSSSMHSAIALCILLLLCILPFFILPCNLERSFFFCLSPEFGCRRTPGFAREPVEG